MTSGIGVARTILLAAAGALLVLSTQAAAQTSKGGSPVGARPAPTGSHQGVVDTYCVTCHSSRQKAGGLVLEGASLADAAANAATWENVIKKVATGAMPPAGMPRPNAEVLGAMVASLERALDGAAAAAPDPGKRVLHRLNRVEYTNAVRDLLRIDIDGQALLPPDASSYGFDNIAENLSLSPALLDRYLMAAQKISSMATGDASVKPEMRRYRLPMHDPLTTGPSTEELSFGSRGGGAITHYVPVDGEYAIGLALQRGRLGSIRGSDAVNEVDVRIDGELVKRFTVGGGAGKGMLAAGGYDEELLRLRVPLKAGTRVIGVGFVENLWAMEGVGPARLPPGSVGFSAAFSAKNVTFGKIEMGIDTVEIEGPFDAMAPVSSPSRDALFVCRPAGTADEEPCAQRILERLAARAFRRPVAADDLTPLIGLYRTGAAEGGFETGIRWGLEAILTHPSFLFRVERDPDASTPGQVYRISDLELASRLSFFLWSTIPDDELRDVAVRGRLSEPRVLEQQVRRMLADSRSEALVKNFFGQWLLLRSLEAIEPSSTALPGFDDSLREAFQRETEMFLRHQLRADRGAMELLTANYTFANERLARHYGIPGVYGSQFRRVAYPDSRRAGLLGQGSILMATSYPNRTSPVVRGKFILENVLATPPPRPPANVPPLPEDKKAIAAKTMRDRMEQHRKNPTCANCHARLDPLGFALENFDSIGGWRTRDGDALIDPSGSLPDGRKFDGPAAFRTVLTTGDAFVKTVAERLLTYALGRGADYRDQPTIRAIVRDAKAQDYRWSSLILGVIKSGAFQTRRAAS